MEHVLTGKPLLLYQQFFQFGRNRDVAVSSGGLESALLRRSTNVVDVTLDVDLQDFIYSTYNSLLDAVW